MTRARIVNRLPQFTADVQRKLARAMTQALVLGTSESAAVTPRHTGNLLNSMYRNVSGDGSKVVGSAGYTAEYAMYVHEASGKLKGLPRPKEGGRDQGVFWGPSGQPEFLRIGFERAEPNIRAVVTGAINTS